MYDRKEMFKAVCSECGDNCEVPFKPTGSKPVLCSSCFGHGGNDRSGGRDRRSFDRGGRSGGRDRRSFDRGGDREMFQATCDECGDKCEVPFRPTAGKPIYCDKCFGKKSDRGSTDRRSGSTRGGDSFRDKRSVGGNDQSSKLFESLNKKLDRVINLLEMSIPGATKKEFQKKEKLEITAPLKLDVDKKIKETKKPISEKKLVKKAVKKLVKKAVKKKK